MSAVLEHQGNVPLKPLCEALGVCRATAQRRLLPPKEPSVRPTPARALDAEERQDVVDVLSSDRFVDRAPAEVFNTLLEDGKYLCSERSMYRILKSRSAVQERRNQLRHPKHARPELVAAAPNEVWSWDITKLRTTVKWSYLHLYVLLDLYSRYVVGWMIAREESAGHAKLLIDETVRKQGVEPGSLIIHSDRGAPMVSKTLAQLYADLDVTRSLSRPRVSNDNPYSESHFKTAKYHPSYPNAFTDLDDGLAWGRRFFPWYNDEHKHGGIAYLTPADVFRGLAEQRLDERHRVLLEAYAAKPQRFPNGPPRRKQLRPVTYINRPAESAEPAVRAGALDAAPEPRPTLEPGMASSGHEAMMALH